MKSTPSLSISTRRSSLVLTSTTALLLAATSPTCSHAQNLRRGSSSSSSDIGIGFDFEDVVSSTNAIEGFEVVGDQIFHEPLIAEVEGNRTETDFEWKRRQRSMLQLEDKEDVEPKEYINDETLAFVDPNTYKHRRIEQDCASDEMPWELRFRTDNYAYETSWKLEKMHQNKTWSLISFGPEGDEKYLDNTLYLGETCLEGAHMYKLTMMDAYNDGFCCSFGSGTYSYAVDGVTEFDSNQQRTFTDKVDHTFYVGMPIPGVSSSSIGNGNGNNGNGNGNSNNGNANGNNGNGNGNNVGVLPFTGRYQDSNCRGDQQKIRVKLWMDRYGDENSWELKSLDTDEVLVSRGLKYYGEYDTDDVSICVPHGRYRFTMTDGIGDGICCQYGDGRYEIYMDNELMIYGSDFNINKIVSHDILVGYHARFDGMSQREIQYLNGHNWRRRQYHRQFGAEYVPLKYDMSLAEDAMSWAVALLDDCDVTGIDHEQGQDQGENLAKNAGNGSWGQLYPVENICRRWFEREETWPYPANAHFTQGLWRSARYVGCAESEKTMDNGGMCRIQVCRYARAGNCDMGKYASQIGDNWKEPMLMDHNPCGPACPPGGCH